MSGVDKMNRPGLIGRKVGMTQIYDTEGNVIPVTVLEVGPCPILNIKTSDKDGYQALQLVFSKTNKRLTKPMKGVYDKQGVDPHKFIKEFRCDSGEYKIGDDLTVDIFKIDDFVDVTGTSKGKGFQGVIKRWGFHGGKDTHGSMFHRRPGSIGQCQWPGRIIKGKKLPGRMGGKKTTVQNLKIVEIDSKNNLMIVKGAVPGPNNGIIYVNAAIKKAAMQVK
jgi:large subunit ribosomal protein L3